MARKMVVRLLGPFEVMVDGRPARLTTGRLRALLAALAMSAGRVVTMERLGDAVWGTDLPGDVRRSLTTYVTRLRAALGDDLIGTEPRGYLLRADRDDVDVYLFQRLTDEARRCPDRVRRRAMLSDALDLWRGVPFEGVPSRSLAETEAPRLVEAYLGAAEQRMDLDIDLERYAGLVADLTELTARFPLRESLWLRLMEVLDRTGSPAEALARYDRMRSHLAEELGVDPRPELQDAYADLLAGQPIRPPGRIDRPVPPAQLPAEVETFTGRHLALARLDALLSGVPIAVVHGAPGVGKSALAVHWAHRVRDRFPDGQLYLDLRGYDADRSALPAATAVRCLLSSLPTRPEQLPSGLSAQAGLLRSLLSGKRMLLVLDNAHDAAQVRPLLPGTAGCLVVVTSRDQLSGLVTAEGAHPMRLDVLTAAEARQLLVRRLGAHRVAAEPGPTDEIVARCAGLPLALAVVAARATTNPAFSLSALAGELRDTQGRLDAFAATDAATDLRAVFSWSYRTLSPAAARLFRCLGPPAAPDITATAAAALAGIPVPQARLQLDEMARVNLVHEHRPGRYAVHDLLRAFAAELAAGQHDRAERTATTTALLGLGERHGEGTSLAGLAAARREIRRLARAGG
ncbi:AfsR/SARP family transcriptional regulator [Actinoplanes sp. ATCC 53533]|uniref:AfsR/SARP family transcriptional regulator n=1 Tax=Actinoplanes sp. ATCC 53533 TaxID=1288362 RepID=UPI0013155412|nr:AfsR/SARP family transcriptional regulator [Actinoplanes sp. ATCC 53533]